MSQISDYIITEEQEKNIALTKIYKAMAGFRQGYVRGWTVDEISSFRRTFIKVRNELRDSGILVQRGLNEVIVK